METPKDAIFRVLIQSKEGDKWKGKEWFYLNASLARFLLNHTAKAALMAGVASLIEPLWNPIMETFLGPYRRK